jgi:ATP-dependent DNA helicase RecQ
VAALEQSGVARHSGETAWATRLDGEEAIDTVALDEHRRFSFARLDAIEAYATSQSCLRARILDYFGDSGHPGRCENCSACSQAEETEVRASRPIAEPATEELFQQLRALRREIADRDGVPAFVVFSDATLRDMAARRPATRAAMLDVSGIGEVKLERYGDAFLAVTATAKIPGPRSGTGERRVPAANSATRDRGVTPSLRQTLVLYEAGRSLADIAAERRLTERTIVDHLLRLIRAGAITSLDGLVSAEAQVRIVEAVGEGSFRELRPLKEQLGDSVTYADLKLVRAWRAAERRTAAAVRS